MTPNIRVVEFFRDSLILIAHGRVYALESNCPFRGLVPVSKTSDFTHFSRIVHQPEVPVTR